MSLGRVSVLWLAVLSSVCACRAAAAVPPLAELLDKYTQALDATQSFISVWEASSVSSCNIPSWGMRTSNVQDFSRGEYRTDDKGRLYARSYRWGYTGSTFPNAPEDRPLYVMQVIGCEFAYRYNRHLGSKYNGHLSYREEGTPGWDDPDRKSWGYFERNTHNNLFLGYVGTKARLDEILRKAVRVSVRPEPERINGALCYTIEARTRRGDFQLWLDSEHGYHPARITVFVGPGDDIGDPGAPHIITRKEGITREYMLHNIRFEKVDGVWVPMEADRTGHIVLGSENGFSDARCHFKRTKIVLDPDHDALGSFENPVKHPELDPELHEGAVVYFGKAGPCTWQGGKIVPREEQE